MWKSKEKSKENSKEKEKEKEKQIIIIKKRHQKKKNKKKKAFTWLQACFLGDVRVIWCNSLGDSHFQTNVIDNVENLFDYYLRITFFVLYTLTSCTH